MSTAKVIPNNPERNSGFEVHKPLADGVHFAGIAPIVHPHTQVATLDMRSRNPRKIRASGFDFRHCCNDGSAAVPFWAGLRTSVNLLKLRKMHVISVPLFNRSHVPAKRVTGDLVNAKRPLTQIAHKLVRADRVPGADVVRENHFGVRVQSKPCPLIAPISGRVNTHVLSVTADHRPEFVKLDKLGPDVADSGIKHPLRVLRCREHQRKNRVFVQAHDAGDGANAHSFQHHEQHLIYSVFVNRVSRQEWSGGGIAEGSRAGGTAITASFVAIEAELLNGLMLAFAARHGLFPLEFCGEKADNEVGSELWLTPRFGLALPTASTESRALLCSIKSRWWFYRNLDSLSGNANGNSCSAHCLSLLSGSPVSAGLSGLTPKSFVALLLSGFSGLRQNLHGSLFPRLRSRRQTHHSQCRIWAGFKHRQKGNTLHAPSCPSILLYFFDLPLLNKPLRDSVDSCQRVAVSFQNLSEFAQLIFYFCAGQWTPGIGYRGENFISQRCFLNRFSQFAQNRESVLQPTLFFALFAQKSRKHIHGLAKRQNASVNLLSFGKGIAQLLGCGFIGFSVALIRHRDFYFNAELNKCQLKK